MGYNTKYALDIRGVGNAEKAEIISMLRVESEDAELGLTMDGKTREPVKWYDWKTEMEVFSKKHPECMFVLEGHGESRDDVWRCYFRNGRIQMAKAKVSFEEPVI